MVTSFICISVLRGENVILDGRLLSVSLLPTFQNVFRVVLAMMSEGYVVNNNMGAAMDV